MDDAALATAKNHLRKSARAARNAMSEVERTAASDAACERLLHLPEIALANCVLMYAAIGTELQTRAAIAGLIASGKRVLLPRVEGDNLVLARSVDATELVAGFRDILEPIGQAVDPEEVDVAVVPGLAFDLDGGRLGQGGGHYDRLFGAFHEATARIGLAFECQLVPRIPGGHWDQPVDLVVTETRIRETGARDEPAS